MNPFYILKVVHKHKKFQNIFRKNNLNIVKCNLKIIDYLDVTLNLLHKPSHKPNSNQRPNRDQLHP